jgi:hypothetical protein
VQPAVADDRADHEGDQQRRGDEEADRADEAEAVHCLDVDGCAHPAM